MPITKPLSSVLLVGLIMSGAVLSADAVALVSEGGEETLPVGAGDSAQMGAPKFLSDCGRDGGSCRSRSSRAVDQLC